MSDGNNVVVVHNNIMFNVNKLWLNRIKFIWNNLMIDLSDKYFLVFFLVLRCVCRCISTWLPL